MRPTKLPPAAIFWLLLLLVSLPLLLMNFRWMWIIAHYQYFPFVLIGVGILAWQRWDKDVAFPRDPLAYALLLAGLIVLALGIWIWSPWLGTISWVLLVGAWMKSQNQSEGFWGLLHLWPPLLLLIRLPMHLDTHLMSWLQRVSSRLSSLMLDMIDLPHRLQGNVFELAGGTLFIGQACSGVQSLFTMLFCSMFLVAWLRRRVTLLPIYLLAAVIWAGCLNVIRIVAIAVSQEWFHLDLLHGWKHDLLGYICLTFAIALLASTDRLIQVLAFPVPASDPAVRFVVWENLWNRVFATRDENKTPVDVVSEPERPESSQSASRGDYRWGKTLLVAAGFLLLIGLAFQVTPLLAEMQQLSKPTATIWTLDQSVIGEEIGDFEFTGYQHVKNSENPALGANSDVWDGVSAGMHVRLIVSQPFYEWHNLAECYGGNGWLLNDQTVIDVPVNNSSQLMWPCDASSWVRSGEHAVLVFSGLDRDGEPVSPPHTSVGGLIGTRLEQNRWRKGMFEQYMMIQLWATSPVEYTQEQVQHLRELHLRARDAVRKRYLHATAGNPEDAGDAA